MASDWKSPEQMKYVRSFMKKRTPEERFWPKVEKSSDPDGCWVWTGSNCAKSISVYGQIFYREEWINGKRKQINKMAHRFAWEDVYKLGAIPEGMTLDHICKNTLCVRPAHLRLATSYQNYVENSTSPHALNAKKTACPRGHPYNPENTAWPQKVRRGREKRGRICLTCHPSYWRWAEVPRQPPPGARLRPEDKERLARLFSDVHAGRDG